MSSTNQAKKSVSKQRESHHCGRPSLSPALLEVARNNLKEFESQSDKSFLVRADIDRKLSSL